MTPKTPDACRALISSNWAGISNDRKNRKVWRGRGAGPVSACPAYVRTSSGICHHLRRWRYGRILECRGDENIFLTDGRRSIWPHNQSCPYKSGGTDIYATKRFCCHDSIFRIPDETTLGKGPVPSRGISKDAGTVPKSVGQGMNVSRL